MADQEKLPTKLEVYGPLLYGKLEFPVRMLEPPSSELPLHLPHVPRARSGIWKSLEELHLGNMTDSWRKERLSSLAKGIKEAFEEDKEHEYPRRLNIEHGELAYRAILRAWDLHLAHTTTPEIPGVQHSFLAEDSFTTILWEVTFRHYYITLFTHQLRSALHQWKKEDEAAKQCKKNGIKFVTDVLRRNHEDSLLRLKGEFQVLEYLRGTLAGEHFNMDLTPAITGNRLAATERCQQTIRAFYNIRGSDELVIYEDKCLQRAMMILKIAARMVDGWETFTSARKPTIQEVVNLYDRKIIEAREMEFICQAHTGEVKETESDWTIHPWTSPY